MAVIARFPNQRPRSEPPGPELSLHTEESPREHEESLAWVRWMFQSIRLRCGAVVFETATEDRAGVIADWQAFAEGPWRGVIAPSLLRGWKSASEGDVAGLLAECEALGAALPEAARERSATAGELLLRATRGALHSGVLGRFREAVEHQRTDSHLAVVWATVAVLFQLPPSDLLTEYLREEWLTGMEGRAHAHPPQGPLAFSALTCRALRETGFGASFQGA